MFKKIQKIFSVVDEKYLSHRLLSESDVVFEIAYQLRQLFANDLIRLNPYLKIGRKKYNFPDITVWRRGKCIIIIEVKEKSRISNKQWKSEKSRMLTYETKTWPNKARNFKAYTYLISHQSAKFAIENPYVHMSVVKEIIAEKEAFKKWLETFRNLSKQKRKRKV